MAVEYHFLEKLECGHEQTCVAFVDPESVIKSHMEFAWAAQCYECEPDPNIPGPKHGVLRTRVSFELVEIVEI